MKTSNFFRRKTEKIKIINDSDLEDYLQSLGILEDIKNKKIHCKFCGQVVTLDNLQALFPDEDKIYIICNRKKCMERI